MTLATILILLFSIAAFPASLSLSIIVGLFCFILAITGLVAVFVLKSEKILNLLFILHLAVTFILLILAVTIVNTNHFESQMRGKGLKKDERIELRDKVHSSLKCCDYAALLRSGPKDPDGKTPMPNCCCEESKLTDVVKVEDKKQECLLENAYQDSCLVQYVRKQNGFRAAAVLCLTIAIILQLLLTFSFHTSQRE